MHAFSYNIPIPSEIQSEETKSLVLDYFKGKNYWIHEESDYWIIKVEEFSEEKLNFYIEENQIKLVSNREIDLLKSELEEYLNHRLFGIKASEEDDMDISKETIETKDSSKLYTWKDLLLPHSGFWVTPILVYVNVLVFLVMVISGVHVFSPSVQDIIDFGGNLRTLTINGGWWRLITANFIHIGIFHLLFNMYALLNIGLILEPIIGKSRFLFAYFITAIGASLTSMWWNEFVVSAGASGAIFGMYGLFLSLLLVQYTEVKMLKDQISSIFLFIGYNIFYGLYIGENIDNAAHIGGLCTGMIVGFVYLPSLSEYYNRLLKWSSMGGMALIALLLSIFMLQNATDDLVEYDNRMVEFDENYQLFLEIYRIRATASKEEKLYEIESRGMYYIRECLKIVEQTEELRLPVQIKELNLKMKEMCEHRISELKFLYKKIDEETTIYDQDLLNAQEKADNLEDELIKIINSTSN